MDKDTSIRHWQNRNDRDRWNRWAESRITALNQLHNERAALQESNNWTFEIEHDWNNKLEDWADSTNLDFSGATFSHEMDFTGFIFPGEVLFQNTIFLKSAFFNNAIFHRRVEFSHTEFSGNGLFYHAKFMREADFIGARFASLADFRTATFSGTANFREASVGNKAMFQHATFELRAIFDLATFAGGTVFDNANFCGQSDFVGVDCSGIASFKNNVTFHSIVRFDRTKFIGHARFVNMTFLGPARFREVEFSDHAIFEEVTFKDCADFDLSKFISLTSFMCSVFEKGVSFRAMRGYGLFSFAGIRFIQVPDFSEAYFEAAPALDNLAWESEHFDYERTAQDESRLPVRWRALRRLASQGHDHLLEVQFLKNETVARRGVLDRPQHFRFWVGQIYQLLSDFGRSMSRPIGWLFLNFFGFSLVYSYLAQVDFQKFLLESPCHAGLGSRVLAAFGLSAYKTLPFATIGLSDHLRGIQACLFGILSNNSPNPMELPESFAPAIPNSVAVLGPIQILLSTVLVFLFLLAVRNQFRIK